MTTPMSSERLITHFYGDDCDPPHVELKPVCLTCGAVLEDEYVVCSLVPANRFRFVLAAGGQRHLSDEGLRVAQAAALEQGTDVFTFGRQQLFLADCIEWLKETAPNSVDAVVTDPPYGLVEYHPDQQKKLRAGRGGVWRIPPSFDGSKRRPLPRFTVLSSAELVMIATYFAKWGAALMPALKPGAHVIIASNPLVSAQVAGGMAAAGFERRGEIVRLVRTFRGGDRPKGAEDEFSDVSAMPRSCWEPWGLYRKPLSERTLAENLRRWGTGGLRRPGTGTPFSDVIGSGTTPASERAVAPHPSVKPQAFMRQIVAAMLPTGEGTVLDTFAGCATTLAACEAKGVDGIGIEIDPHYFAMAQESIPALSAL